MTEISEIVKRSYRRSRMTIDLMFIASIILIAIPLWYEASIDWIHVTSMERLSLGSMIAIMLWFSGFCFGTAAFWKKVIQKIEAIF